MDPITETIQNVRVVSSFGPKYPPKYPRKNLTNSALEFEKLSNQQNKCTFLYYYNLQMIIWVISGIKDIIECLIRFDHFLDSRAEFVKFFSLVFWSDDTIRTF